MTLASAGTTTIASVAIADDTRYRLSWQFTLRDTGNGWCLGMIAATVTRSSGGAPVIKGINNGPPTTNEIVNVSNVAMAVNPIANTVELQVTTTSNAHVKAEAQAFVDSLLFTAAT